MLCKCVIAIIGNEESKQKIIEITRNAHFMPQLPFTGKSVTHFLLFSRKKDKHWDSETGA